LASEVLGNNPFEKKKRDSIWSKPDEEIGSGPAVCSARTISGRRCRNRAVAGGTYCAVHRKLKTGSGRDVPAIDEIEDRSQKETEQAEGTSGPEKPPVVEKNLNSHILYEKEARVEKEGGSEDGITAEADSVGIHPDGSVRSDEKTSSPGAFRERTGVDAGTGGKPVDFGGRRIKDEVNRIFLNALEEAHKTIPGVTNREFFDFVGQMVQDQTGRHLSRSGIKGTIEQNLAAVISALPLAQLAEWVTTTGSGLFDEAVKSIKATLTMAIALWNPAREENIDEFGFDREFADSIVPLFDFLYTRYWRVDASGLENVPDNGRALLVANHSGVLPWDATMLTMAIRKHHPGQRNLRCLMLDLFATMPFLSMFFVRTGQLRACPENGIQLLDRDHLVAVFPEGLKGIGKLYSKRYQLQRFGRGGFIKLAINTDSPIVPVSIVGGEEIYPLLYRADWLANLFDFPYFPITLTFPWFGLLGLVPLPSRWYIEFGRPVDYSGYGAEAVSDDVLINSLSNEVKNTIQEMIYDRLKKRTSIFF